MLSLFRILSRAGLHDCVFYPTIGRVTAPARRKFPARRFARRPARRRDLRAPSRKPICRFVFSAPRARIVHDPNAARRHRFLPARHALERAALIAQAHPDARLTLAHVVNATLLAVKQRSQAPYRRILAAVDFSPHAAAAINAAHAWLPDADIVLLHAFEVEFESTLRLAGMDDGRINAYRFQAREAAKARMDAFVATLDAPAHRLTREFVHGAATMRIVEYEQSLDADLVVMGKRGLSVLEELLLGNVTQHVLAYSRCGVFIASHG